MRWRFAGFLGPCNRIYWRMEKGHRPGFYQGCVRVPVFSRTGKWYGLLMFIKHYRIQACGMDSVNVRGTLSAVEKGGCSAIVRLRSVRRTYRRVSTGHVPTVAGIISK